MRSSRRDHDGRRERPEANASPVLRVQGCANKMIGSIVTGVYLPVSRNHGKSVWRRESSNSRANEEVLIYYWDDRDGPELAGWWFGPSVGGDQVWAYHSSTSSNVPPETDWNVPHDGPIDRSFRVMKSSGRDRDSGEPSGRRRSSRRPPSEEEEEEGDEEEEEGEDGDEVEEVDQRSRQGHHRERRRGRSQPEGYGRDGRDKAGAAEDLKQMDDLKRKMEEHKRREEEIRRQITSDKDREKEPPKPKTDAVQQFKERLLARAMNRDREAREPRESREPRSQSGVDHRSSGRDGRESARERESAAASADGDRSRSPLVRKREPEAPPPQPTRRDREPRDRESRRQSSPPAAQLKESSSSRRGYESSRGRREDLDEQRRQQEEDIARRRQYRREEAAKESADRERARDERERRHREEEEERRRTREKERRREEERAQQEREKEKRRREEDQSRRREEEREKNEKDEKKREQERKAKEDERRQHEEELERKRAARRKEEEEARKKIEEDRRVERDRRRKEEEELKKKEKERKDIEERQRAEQERVQEEERLRQLAEQQATLVVLQVLQKLSMASPESFDTLKKELQEVLAEQLPKCGNQKDTLKAEADRVVEYIETYMTQLQERQQQMEEERKVQEAVMVKQEKKTTEMLKEMEQLATAAEDATLEAYQASDGLTLQPDGDAEQILKVVKDFETAAKTAMESCKKCADFMVDKRNEMDEAERLRSDVAGVAQSAMPRIQGCSKVVAAIMQKSTVLKEKTLKRLKAEHDTSRQVAVFRKYDKDQDKLLNRKEVIDYAKHEHDFDPPPELLDRFFEVIVGRSAQGVAQNQLMQLKTFMGTARVQARLRKMRLAREEEVRRSREQEEARKAVCQKKRDELMPQIQELRGFSKSIESKTAALEKSLKECSQDVDNIFAEDLATFIAEARGLLQQLEEELPRGRGFFNMFMGEISQTEGMEEFMVADLASFNKAAAAAEGSCNRATGSLAQLDAMQTLKSFTEKEAVRMDVAMRLRSCAEEHGYSLRRLFSTVDKDAKGVVSKADILSFLESYGGKLLPEVLDQAIEVVQKLPRSFLLDPARSQLPDASTQQTELMSLHPGGGMAPAGDAPGGERQVAADETGGGKLPAALPPGEVPKPDAPSAGDAQAENAQPENVAMEGQQLAEGDAGAAAAGKEIGPEPNPQGDGSADPSGVLTKEEFQRLLRLHYRVVRQIILSDALSIKESKQIRRVDVGEVIEVHEGPTMDPSVGVMRIYGCVLKDGMMGWATIAGNQGIIFLVRGGTSFKVTRPAWLNMALKDTEESTAIRHLQAGEVLEVVDWARTSRSALGVSRVCVRCQADGLFGWCTLSDQGGGAFLEVLS